MKEVAKTRIDNYKLKYAERTIRFNDYTAKKTGLIQSQTVLKIEDYVMVCAPFQLSMERVILLVILSRQETVFFQQMLNKMCSVNFSFTKPSQANPIHFFVRGVVHRINPVKGKANVCIIDVVYKVCPDDLVEIIGNYITSYDSLRILFEDYKGRAVQLDNDSKRLMKFNDFIESQIGGKKVRTRLRSLAVDKLVLAVPEYVAGLELQKSFTTKLYFQTFQFSVNGKVERLGQSENGFRTMIYAIDFSPELVEILDNYFFLASLRK